MSSPSRSAPAGEDAIAGEPPAGDPPAGEASQRKDPPAAGEDTLAGEPPVGEEPTHDPTAGEEPPPAPPRNDLPAGELQAPPRNDLPAEELQAPPRNDPPAGELPAGEDPPPTLPPAGEFPDSPSPDIAAFEPEMDMSRPNPMWDDVEDAWDELGIAFAPYYVKSKCVICFKVMGFTAVQLDCLHYFHSSCISEWVNNHALDITCPYCGVLGWSDPPDEDDDPPDEDDDPPGGGDDPPGGGDDPPGGDDDPPDEDDDPPDEDDDPSDEDDNPPDGGEDTLVLDNYVDILRNNLIYLQDKGKLKNVLGGLLRCLSLLVSKKEEDDLSYKPDMVGQRLLHTYKPDAPAGISSVIEKDLMPLLVNCFQESISLIRDDAESFDCMLLTLQCINLAVKIVIDAINKAHVGFEPFLTSQSNGSHVIRSTMLVLLKKLWQTFPIGQMHESNAKEDDKYFVLNVIMAEIFVHLSDGINDTTFPFAKFLEFVECILLGQVGSNLSSNKVLLQKHLCSIISFIPELRAQVVGDWKARLLEAFTSAFKHFKADSRLFLRYLYAMENILCNDEPSIRSSDQDLSGHKIAWLKELSKILLHLGDKNSFVSKVILNLMLKIGQHSVPNSPLALEYEYMQYLLKEFYCTKTISESVLYGPFVKLPPDCQELAIYCLYYIPNLSTDILESLACCCLCVDLEPNILLRIVAILDSAYIAGHLQISYYIGFLVTLVARFKVFPEKFNLVENDGELSNRETFNSLTASACRCFQAMGDNSLVLKLMCNVLFNRILLKPPLDNLHGFLKMMVVLDVKLTKLSEDGISKLSDWLSSYLIDAVSHIPENVDVCVSNDQIRVFRYYVQPCLFLFYGSEKLLCYVLKLLDSLTIVDESFSSHSDVKLAPELLSRVHAITSILIFLHNYGKLHRNLSSSTTTINHILRNVHKLLVV